MIRCFQQHICYSQDVARSCSIHNSFGLSLSVHVELYLCSSDNNNNILSLDNDHSKAFEMKILAKKEVAAASSHFAFCQLNASVPHSDKERERERERICLLSEEIHARCQYPNDSRLCFGVFPVSNAEGFPLTRWVSQLVSNRYIILLADLLNDRISLSPVHHLYPLHHHCSACRPVGVL